MKVAILDNLRSAWNVGSVFRTARALGYDELALCGVTMTPPSPKLRETSRGMEDELPWKAFSKTQEALDHYRALGCRLVALELAENSVDFVDWTIPSEGSIAWVLGNEAKGVAAPLLEQVDEIVSLPMLSEQASINVACAFSAAAYGLLFKERSAI